MRLVDSDDFVVLFRIDKDDVGRLLGPGHAVNTLDLHTQNVLIICIPRHGLALADVPEEMVFRTGRNLLDLQLERLGIRRRNERAHDDEKAACRDASQTIIAGKRATCAHCFTIHYFKGRSPGTAN